MKELVKLILICIAIITVLFSFNQLDNNNRIFADSRAHCCNNNLCNAENCSSPSSCIAGWWDSKLGWQDCTEYTNIDCGDCIDWEVSNCVCYGPSNNVYCMNGDERYYGTQVACPAQK
jgi:hypothetical protein